MEANWLENKIGYLENNKIDVNSLKENYKGFSKDNRLVLKSKQRFGSKKNNVLTKGVKKIALSSKNENEKKNEKMKKLNITI